MYLSAPWEKSKAELCTYQYDEYHLMPLEVVRHWLRQISFYSLERIMLITAWVVSRCVSITANVLSMALRMAQLPGNHHHITISLRLSANQKHYVSSCVKPPIKMCAQSYDWCKDAASLATMLLKFRSSVCWSMLLNCSTAGHCAWFLSNIQRISRELELCVGERTR